MCGEKTSGRMRIRAAKEEGSRSPAQHFTFGKAIDFVADRTIRFRSPPQHPLEDEPSRSIYIRKESSTTRHPAYSAQTSRSQGRDQHIQHIAAHGTGTSRRNDDDDGIPSRDFWKACAEDPDRLAHKEREKRQRAEDREDERSFQKSQKLDPYVCCKRPAAFPWSFPVGGCHDWLLHNGNVHYTRRRDNLESFRPVAAWAHITETSGNENSTKLRHVSVTGIGTLKLTVKRQLSHNATNELMLVDTLYVPDAPCNGISLALLKQDEHRLKQHKIKSHERWHIRRTGSKAIICCGNSSSGHKRLQLPGEDDAHHGSGLISEEDSINIFADLPHISDAAGRFEDVVKWRFRAN